MVQQHPHHTFCSRRCSTLHTTHDQRDLMGTKPKQCDTTLWVEVDTDIADAVADCPRMAAHEHAAQLTVAHLSEQLPDQVIVELHPHPELPAHLTADPAVGCHIISMFGLLMADHRIAVAVGHNPADSPEDDASWHARLTTVIHELLHVTQWWQTHQTTPQQAGRQAALDWAETAADCRDIETQARQIADGLLAGIRRPGRCPETCADLHTQPHDH